MYESMRCACQDRNHLHLIRVTDGRRRFDSNAEQDLTCSPVIIRLIFTSL